MEHPQHDTSSTFGFVISLLQLIAGISATGAAEWDVPDNVIHVFQCFAFAGAGLTGLVAGLNYCGINPFKKKK